MTWNPDSNRPGARTANAATRRWPAPTVATVLALALATGACGAAAAPTAEAPSPETTPTDAGYRGVPGFDTRDYPGDAVMAGWLENSPYRWVGYYLPAPCHTGTSWLGTRSRLRDMGWGIALIFVGEQDWPTTTDTALAQTDRDARCVAANLSRSSGRADGAAAANAARSEGFPEGTVVYLDVEPVESVSDSLAAYVTGWTAGLREAGYAPGLYAHARNAERLLQIMGDAADGQLPRLWVARPGGFSLRRGPMESGYAAAVWQGILDIEETWGGNTLRIDANVADRRDPSAPEGR